MDPWTGLQNWISLAQANQDAPTIAASRTLIAAMRTGENILDPSAEPPLLLRSQVWSELDACVANINGSNACTSVTISQYTNQLMSDPSTQINCPNYGCGGYVPGYPTCQGSTSCPDCASYPIYPGYPCYETWSAAIMQLNGQIQHAGTGCPDSNSVVAVPSAIGDRITLVYLGQEANATNSTVSCQVTIPIVMNVFTPANWIYPGFYVSQQYSVSLSQGISGNFTWNAGINILAATNTTTQTFTGVSQNQTYNYQASFSQAPNGPGVLTISTNLSVPNADATSFAQANLTTVQLSTIPTNPADPSPPTNPANSNPPAPNPPAPAASAGEIASPSAFGGLSFLIATLLAAFAF